MCYKKANERVKAMGEARQRQRYSIGAVNDVDMLYGIKEELDSLQAELEAAKDELRRVKRLIWKHRGKDDEILFYAGAELRRIELLEEIECLEPEIEATAAVYIAGVVSMMGRYDDGA